MASMIAEKDRIAAAALREIPSEGAIPIDAGTTTARRAEIPPTERLPTIVTNSLPIATMLSMRPSFTVPTTGGRVRERTLAGVDEWAARSLSEICRDVAFVGAGGVSVGGGLTTPDPPAAAVKRAMLHAARGVVAPAGSSKVGRDYFASFGRLDDVDVLITDSGLDKAEAATPAAAAGRRWCGRERHAHAEPQRRSHHRHRRPGARRPSRFSAAACRRPTATIAPRSDSTRVSTGISP